MRIGYADPPYDKAEAALAERTAERERLREFQGELSAALAERTRERDQLQTLYDSVIDAVEAYTLAAQEKP